MPARHIIPTLRQTFLHGIIAGVGWALGATIVFAILITFLGQVFNLLEHIPLIGRLFYPMAEIVGDSTNPTRQVIEQSPSIRLQPSQVDN